NRRAARPGAGRKAARTVHARAVSAWQDSRADDSRHLVESHYLDADVQRPARQPRDSQPVPVLVLSVSHRAAVLVQRRNAAPRPARSALDHRPTPSPAGAGPNGARGAQHGWAGGAASDLRKRRQLLEDRERPSNWVGEGHRPDAAGTRRGFLLPPESVG